MVESYNKHRSLSISQWRTGLFSSEHWADVSYGWSKEMWLWEETWRESLTFSCIQKSFNASKDIQGWVDTVNLNLLTQNQYLFYLLVHRFDTTAKKQTLQKQNRTNFIGSITAGFDIYRRIGWNLFRTVKIVKIAYFMLNPLKRNSSSLFNRKLEQGLAVAGLVVKSRTKECRKSGKSCDRWITRWL